TPNRLRYDAIQAARRHLVGMDELFGGVLSADARAAAEQLAGRVPGQLGLFVGAGISMGAGLPGWRELLIEVAARLDDGELAEELAVVLAERRVDPLDAASLLAARLGQDATAGDRALREAVAEVTRAVPRHALAHGLLASLGVARAVTTNYDDLYERARDGARLPVAVLPYARPDADAAWLLKLHGDVDHVEDIVLTRQD